MRNLVGNVFKNKFGDIINEKLVLSGMSRAELAVKSGRSVATIQRCLLSNRSTLGYRSLLTVIFALGLALSDVLKPGRKLPKHMQQYWDRLIQPDLPIEVKPKRRKSPELFKTNTYQIIRDKMDADGITPNDVASILSLGATTVEKLRTSTWGRADWRTIYYVAHHLGINPSKTLLRPSVKESSEMAVFHQAIKEGLTPTGRRGLGFWNTENQTSVSNPTEEESITQEIPTPVIKLVPKPPVSTGRVSDINTQVNELLTRFSELEKEHGKDITNIMFGITFKDEAHGIHHTITKGTEQ
jgi:hypothetical protein